MTTASEESLANLPSDSLDDMLSSLQVSISFFQKVKFISIIYTFNSNETSGLQIILINLRQQEKEINALDSNIGDTSNVSDVKDLIIQLKRRILLLISRTTSGITFITVSFRITSSLIIDLRIILNNFFSGYNSKADSTQSGNRKLSIIVA